MQELIKVSQTTINGAEVNSVNSREVYEYLKVGTEYANWIKRAIEKYGFEEDIDFAIFVKPLNNQKDYIVTLDMAKELCMVSNTEKGREVRKYFIQCEKDLNKPMTVEQVLEMNNRLISNLQNKVIVLQDKINNDAPKVEYAKAVVTAINGCSIRDWVSSMKQENGLKVGERKVINFLLSIKELYRSNSDKLKPYSNKFDNFSLEPIVIATPTGNKEIMSLKITGTGQLNLTSKVLEYFMN